MHFKSVLIFEDLKLKIADEVRRHMPGFADSFIELDSTGRADFTLKLFRFSRDPNFKSIAESLVSSIKSLDFVETCELSGNYLNVRIKTAFILDLIEASINEKAQYPDTFQDPDRVLVEHTSTNPTGPIHVGRTRNSVIGDSLANLLRRYGYRVSTQYLVNDTGKQVLGLYLGYLESGRPVMTIQNLLEGYKRVYKQIEENKDKEKEIESLIKKYESGDGSIVRDVKSICTVMLDGIRKSLLDLGIKIDDYVWESGFLKSDEMENVINRLGKYLKDENSAKYIETKEGKKIFIRRSDGTSLYVLRDLAYHLFKSLNYDWLIDVLGEDHKDYVKGLKEILEDKIELRSSLSFVFYSYVSLESGKMSTRSGNVVTLDELVERATEKALEIVRAKRLDLDESKLKEISRAVAISAIRFNIVRINPEKQLIFRWEEALSFDGDSAPFIMYSYARTTNIIANYTPADNVQTTDDFNTYEKALVFKMYSFPYCLNTCRESLRVDPLASYLLELVRLFNDFYNNCRVLGSGDDEPKRILIVNIYRKIIQDASSILGIRLIDEM